MENRNAFFEEKFKVRAEPDGGKYIEGYFAVFNQRTELWQKFFEEIAPGAFDKSLKENDIRCLFNHNPDVVLARTASGTLELRTDAHGLWGSLRVNEDDKQALDVYARVSRGDISGCSFGFVPMKEEYDKLGDDDVLCRILEADVREVSVCVFPAYPQTEVQARRRDFEKARAASSADRVAAIRQRLENLKV
ncbi:MAG: HK97 family phage prohead protease [Oscillospiraceae bacterium]|nr:HK97 family phage prohead protease [Oscillospiraceae bacterium]